MKKLWIQYIVMILCAGMLFAAFPAFTDRIQLAEAEVEWQDDAYVNQFGDTVIPLPPSSQAVSSMTAAVSSELTSSDTKSSVSSLPESSTVSSSPAVSEITTEPTISTVPLPLSSAPASSKPASSAAAPASSFASSSEPASPSGETVFVLEGKDAVQYQISDILPRIVEAEIGGSSPPEAIKAQAVASHTFLRYYNDIEKKAPAVSQKTPTDAVVKACMEVIDKIVTVDGKPVYTPYCAATAGRTNASEEVWVSPLSHLRSVESIYDSEDSTNWDRRTEISVSDVKAKLSAKFGVTITGEPAGWMKVLDYTQGGYNKNMTVCGAETTGRYIRESVLSLRSAWFTWVVEGDSFIFTTRGYGHGVGLSQMGAVGYAKHGYDYEWILTHYYTGVKISTV